MLLRTREKNLPLRRQQRVVVPGPVGTRERGHNVPGAMRIKVTPMRKSGALLNEIRSDAMKPLRYNVLNGRRRSVRLSRHQQNVPLPVIDLTPLFEMHARTKPGRLAMEKPISLSYLRPRTLLSHGLNRAR